VDYPLNIHSMCAGVRQMSDWILIQCMQGSGRLLIEYSFGVCRDLAHDRPNIYSVYAGVRWIINQIFICMQGSGELLTKYSFGVWMG
jgi:hypothetical protein